MRKDALLSLEDSRPCRRLPVCPSLRHPPQHTITAAGHICKNAAWLRPREAWEEACVE